MTTLRDQWQALGRAGNLGVGLPSRFGGQGGGPAEVWLTARRVGRTVFDLGVGLSWIANHIVSRFQLGKYGTEEQKAAWLPRLASGDSMAAMALEEPAEVSSDSGQVLVARQTADGAYRLNGYLAGVLNAPVADLLVVFAPVSGAEEIDQIGAFLLHRDTPGLTFEPAPDRGYCPASPQANALFDGCAVPAESQLGSPEQAVEMLRRLGRQFDILRLEVICGYLVRLSEEVKPHLQRSDRTRLSMLVTRGRLQALQSLNDFLANHWDDGDQLELAAAEAAARELIRLTREDLSELPDHPAVAAAQRDLQLVRLGWRRTRDRFLDTVRAEEDGVA